MNEKELIEASRGATAINHEAKKLALARRNACAYTIEFIPVLQQRLQAYVDETTKQGQPLTVSGGILASGVPFATWYEMKDGKKDHVIYEYLIMNDLPEDTTEVVTPDGEIVALVPFSELIKRFYLQVAEQRETACASLRGNPAGNIFLLKAQHGYKEEETPQHLTQAVVIADSEQARKALDLLR